MEAVYEDIGEGLVICWDKEETPLESSSVSLSDDLTYIIRVEFIDEYAELYCKTWDERQSLVIAFDRINDYETWETTGYKGPGMKIILKGE